MKDLHTHILYGIDDGAKSIEESIAILKKASYNGITDIVLTPHYIKDSIYNANNQTKEKLLKKLKQELKNQNININLYLGNEVYITEDIISLYKEIFTINNSRYILIELPLTTKYPFVERVISELINNNLIPIIAHPERNLKYYKDYKFFEDLITKGCLLQANIGSLYGYYGRRSKKMFKGLLKRNMIHFIGSDIHHYNNTIYEKNIRKDLIKITKNEKMVEDILINNTDKVLKNKKNIIGVN